MEEGSDHDLIQQMTCGFNLTLRRTNPHSPFHCGSKHLTPLEEDSNRTYDSSKLHATLPLTY